MKDNKSVNFISFIGILNGPSRNDLSGDIIVSNS